MVESPWVTIVVALVVGVVTGGGIAWLVMRARVARLEGERDGHRASAARADDLTSMLAPIRAGVEQSAQVLAQLDHRRAEHFGAVAERLDQVTQVSDALRGETQALVQALRAPQVRGQWGEMQLRRVVELAGMLEQCDFQTQVTVAGDDGIRRPDLVVRLSGGRSIVVDAKTPLSAYLDAIAAPDLSSRAARLQQHAQQVRAQVQQLAQKRYWAQFADTPEFVVLFLPGEAFFAAALEADPTLLDVGAGQRVLLATPTTLIALLRAAAVGWREARLADGAAELSALGRELHQRLSVMSEHFADVGGALGKAVDAYNRTLGSLDRQVLTSARRFEALGAASSRAIDTPPAVTAATRTIETPPADSTATRTIETPPADTAATRPPPP
jgi:DNA recombination protein RmuC